MGRAWLLIPRRIPHDVKSCFTGGSNVSERKTSDPGELDGYDPSKASNIKAGKQFIKDAKAYNKGMPTSKRWISRLSALGSTTASRKTLTPDATQVSRVSEVPTEGTRGNATSAGGDPDYEDRRSVPGAIPVRFARKGDASATSTSRPL